MQRKLAVSSSPFLRNTAVSTRRLMGDVVIALLPTALAAVWFFGAPALGLILVSVAFAVLSEMVYERLTHQKNTISDLSAVVTGLLLAFNLPANAPWWMAAIGAIIAIVLVKQMFGGIGQNFINPALASRTILMLSWAGLMAATAMPNGGQLFGLGSAPVDAVASATPLVNSSYSLWQLFIGDIPGMLGETCKLTLLLGGVYLIVRRVIDWRVPVAFIATAFILFWIQTGVIYSVESGTDNALYQILSGGLMLGAFFMATDYVTCPITKWGRVFMGVGCAAILFVIRTFNSSYPEGCSFGILFMNVLTPLIDKWTAPRSFGAVKPPRATKTKAGKDSKGGAQA
ncbi:MAG: RnfABCDGE type electron transport complex subunit D [Clostridiales bacterium]|nr:RnfABCDGE type electron transport complex subunit D [Clostridiales bacterium]MDO4349991.1 RnfABCDGE type electron transport complex subunit D [Eubacteriales bacterium]MDY4009672.1 RnfABCDGE type electron transport complex subunit D [Candidatus Limiplasma sp.]